MPALRSCGGVRLVTRCLTSWLAALASRGCIRELSLHTRPLLSALFSGWLGTLSGRSGPLPLASRTDGTRVFALLNPMIRLRRPVGVTS